MVLDVRPLRAERAASAPVSQVYARMTSKLMYREYNVAKKKFSGVLSPGPSGVLGVAVSVLTRACSVGSLSTCLHGREHQWRTALQARFRAARHSS